MPARVSRAEVRNERDELVVAERVAQQISE